MLLGRLRGATSQQLGEAARQLGARLQRHQAQDRRDQRATELDRAAELLHGVAAGIPPAPLPRPRTSQSSTPDRVQ